MSKWCDVCYRNEVTMECKSCGEDCPIFGKNFEALARHIIENNIETHNKVVYKTVEQECSRCGKHFRMKYCSDGSYVFLDTRCECIATFRPVDWQQPAICEWLEWSKKERERHA